MMSLGPRLRKALRYFIIGGLVSTVLLAVLAVAAVAFARQVASRIVINIDPNALGQAIYEGMAVSIETGTPEEKLRFIAAFDSARPAEVASYVPLIEEAEKDPDPAVSHAARKVLDRINAAKPSMPRE